MVWFLLSSLDLDWCNIWWPNIIYEKTVLSSNPLQYHCEQIKLSYTGRSILNPFSSIGIFVHLYANTLLSLLLRLSSKSGYPAMLVFSSCSFSPRLSFESAQLSAPLESPSAIEGTHALKTYAQSHALPEAAYIQWLWDANADAERCAHFNQRETFWWTTHSWPPY